jgi:hypothetical protein
MLATMKRPRAKQPLNDFVLARAFLACSPNGLPPRGFEGVEALAQLWQSDDG